MISSTANSQVKYVIALGKQVKFRKESGLFVIEGSKMFQELPKERVRQVYVTETFFDDSDHRNLLRDVGNARIEMVTETVMKAMSATQTPQGILAIVSQYQYSMKDLKNSKATPLFVVLETIQDPGNLGTILRAGEGAGITGVIMDKNTADIYNPKVIRATMGSIYRVPFLYTDDLTATIKELKQDGICLYAAHLSGKNNYDQENYTKAAGFLIGNEAKGLKKETAEMADIWVKIPMLGKVESLNAAVASSVLMFEAARQRRLSGK